LGCDNASPIPFVHIDLPEKNARSFSGGQGMHHFFVSPVEGNLLAIEFGARDFDISLLNCSESGSNWSHRA
jgi:hypothetical protein